MTELRVSRLLVTPVKGLQVSSVSEIELGPSGAVGNREFFLVGEDDKVLSLRTLGQLLEIGAGYDPATGRLTLIRDGLVIGDECVQLGHRIDAPHAGMRVIAGRLVDGPWNALLSDCVQRNVRLVKTVTSADGFDLHPVTLLGRESVAELERRAGGVPVDSRRFRMLIEFGGLTPHVEDTWNGQRMAIGSAEIQIGGPVPRCAATTRHPEYGDRDQPVVRMIRAYRGVGEDEWGKGVHFGVYATVASPGVIRIGDPLALV